MSKQAAPSPLEGKLTVVGARPGVSPGDRDATLAELSIALTGGSGRTPIPITFSVALNIPVSGRARLTDDSSPMVVAESTRSGSALVWSNVPVIPPGLGRTRTIRITNLRGNANQIGVSSTLVPTQIVAFVSVAAPFRIPLAGAQQNVAEVRGARAAAVPRRAPTSQQRRRE